MTETIFCGTPKRASTVQRRVWSTESYALVRLIKNAYNGICLFRPNSCSRRITNIISVVERFGRKPLCFSGRIPTRSQYSLRRRAIIFSSILPACPTSEMPLQLLHSIRSSFIWNTNMMASFHCGGTSPPLQIQTTMPSSLRRMAGSPLRDHIMVTVRYSNQQGSKSRQNPCQVQPTENIGNLSASRRCLRVRTTVFTVFDGVLPVFQNLNYKQTKF